MARNSVPYKTVASFRVALSRLCRFARLGWDWGCYSFHIEGPCAFELFIVVGLLAITCCGCTTYYSVRDSASGREYITDNWNLGQNPYTGSMAIKDLQSGKTVVLQSYEMERMKTDEAKAILGLDGR